MYQIFKLIRKIFSRILLLDNPDLKENEEILGIVSESANVEVKNVPLSKDEGLGVRSNDNIKRIYNHTNNHSSFNQQPNFEPDDLSEILHIGYNPVNIFAQSEPLNFPYVIMPEPNCIVKPPNKGKQNLTGVTEKDFYNLLANHFGNDFEVLDNCYIKTKLSSQPYEPDIALVYQKKGLNLFIDIEIDEPYQGISGIENRKPLHFQNEDINRNNAFKKRGWIVVRFAEIQIVQNPEGCALFIAQVIQSIHPEFKIQAQLQNSEKIEIIKQWTEEEAIEMSIKKEREKYLGREFSNIEDKNQQITIPKETTYGNNIEGLIKDEPFIQGSKIRNRNPKQLIELPEKVKITEIRRTKKGTYSVFFSPLDSLKPEKWLYRCSTPLKTWKVGDILENGVVIQLTTEPYKINGDIVSNRYEVTIPEKQ